MQAHIDNTHRQLGELAAMSHQTQEAERRILARAQEMLTQIEADIPAARSASLTGDGDHYMHLIAERGRLQQVVASSRQYLET